MSELTAKISPISHGQLISVSEDVYYTFYRFKRYELNLEEKDSRNQKVLFSNLDTEKMTGEEMIPDENMEPVEDEAIRNIMIEKLKQAIVGLRPAEREILDLIYFQGFSERQAGALLKINQSVVNKKKMRALKKMRFFMEHNY
jgi:RNA polymerase sigma factor (sigma-70 family)